MCENNMCGENMHGMRHFLTKEEKMEILKEYKQNLETEAKAVGEKISEIERNN